VARSAIIFASGQVLEQVQSNLFRVALGNGHEFLGHVSERIKIQCTRVLPGVRVSVQLTPRDLSKGQILDVLEQV
jgi:translation initiation factor IF-1